MIKTRNKFYSLDDRDQTCCKMLTYKCIHTCILISIELVEISWRLRTFENCMW